MKCMPYVDYMFGNESEAAAFGKKMGYKDCSPANVALEIYKLPKENKSRSRIVVITQGSDSTIVVRDGKVTKFDVPKVPAEEIVDVNGAGDAFLGGFLSQMALGKPLEDSVRAGHYAARVILGVSGTVLHGKPGKW